ncbi:MAG: radical SAM protein, partial [Elusimicrobiota bacterium]
MPFLLAMSGTTMSRRRLQEYLATFAWDQYYFPMDGPFQNYTYFEPMGMEEVKACWRKTLGLMKAGRAPKEIGIYLHWPFCPSQCTYCYCSMCVPKGKDWAASYAAMLKREMDEFRGLFKGTRFGSVWLGGGTPTYMPQEELDGLLGHLRESFELEPGAQVYVESSPATLTAGKMEVLARHGVNRMTLGVQSLDAEVLKRIDRAGQTRETVERAWELIKRWPGILTDVDVMFGLEGQTPVSFVRDLGWAVGKGPDAIHLYGFEPRAQTLFARGGGRLPEERRASARQTVAAAERVLSAAGYRTARVDAQKGADLPEERQDGAVRRLGASVLGFGHSAISHAFGSAWYHHPLVPRADKITRAIPPFRGMRSGLEEEMRGYALRHLSLYRRLSRRAFAGAFGLDILEVRGLAAAVRDMETDDQVRVSETEIVCDASDEGERLAGLKRLYSPAAVKAILKGRRRALAAFKPGSSAAAAEKIADRGLFRVYFKEPSRQRLYRFLALVARSEDYPPKDGPFQNYTYFEPMGLEEVKACWRKTLRLMKEGRAPKEIGIYLHWPFCPSQCTYCYCSMCVPKGKDWAASYAAMLKREMDEFRGLFK